MGWHNRPTKQCARASRMEGGKGEGGRRGCKSDQQPSELLKKRTNKVAKRPTSWQIKTCPTSRPIRNSLTSWPLKKSPTSWPIKNSVAFFAFTQQQQYIKPPAPGIYSYARINIRTHLLTHPPTHPPTHRMDDILFPPRKTHTKIPDQTLVARNVHDIPKPACPVRQLKRYKVHK